MFLFHLHDRNNLTPLWKQILDFPTKLQFNPQIYELTHKGEPLPRSVISSLLTTLYYMLGYPADLQVGQCLESLPIRQFMFREFRTKVVGVSMLNWNMPLFRFRYPTFLVNLTRNNIQLSKTLSPSLSYCV